MNGEHDDHESVDPDATEPASAGADHGSGPRISARPVDDVTPDASDAAARRSQAPNRASGPPPKPRLKDSKYPPPAVASGESEPPKPRAKVISSPDLPPARPRSSAPPEADEEVSSAGEAQQQLAQPLPPVPPAPRPPSVDASALGAPREIEVSSSARAPELARAISPSRAGGGKRDSDQPSLPPRPSSGGEDGATRSESAPPRTTSERVLAPPPLPPNHPSQRVVLPPKSPADTDPPLARRPDLAPTQEVPAVPRASSDTPPRLLSPPPKRPTGDSVVIPPPPTRTTSDGDQDSSPPLASNAPQPAAHASEPPEIPTPPPRAAAAPTGGAATSYPPPSTAAPKVDPIAVHAIRVISVALEDEPTLTHGAGETSLNEDEYEELEDFSEAEEIEPPPDSLDESEVEALTDDDDDGVTVDVDVAPTVAEPSNAGVKPPPPPKRAPSPPKKKSPKAPPRKRRPWWEEVFSEDFSRATHHPSSRHIKKEVDFIDHSLGVAQGAVLLDLACGSGEHSIELAARGYSVVGYDLSVFQLAVAGEAAQERGLKINFLQGDMREMAFQEMFDGIFCWNTSFGYFEEEKNVGVAERIYQALRPGGMFLIDVVNRDHVMQHQPSQVWFQGDACVCMDDMSVDYITSRLRVKRSIIMDDGRTRECFYSMRLYTLHELGKLLHEVGFRVIEASGHPTTPGVYLGPNSPRVIILAQRP